VELYYHPPFADDEVGIKVLIFSEYGILPYEMTETICCYWIVYVLFMALWKTSLEAILTLLLDGCFRFHIYFSGYSY
jgi:hypothetical protein